MKGGIGTASLKLDNGIVIGAIVAVNSVGNVIDPKTGRTIAGARSADGHGYVGVMEWSGAGIFEQAANTTIGVIATNVPLTKTQLKKIAQMGHDGMARVINPVHTPWDGDTLFAISTGSSANIMDTGRIGALTAEVVSQAILRAVKRAKSLPGYPDYPAWEDLSV
jgi:L-aminopeptidase/D-esterase-like protein